MKVIAAKDDDRLLGVHILGQVRPSSTSMEGRVNKVSDEADKK